MALDASTVAFAGTGLTVTAALIGVAVNLRIGRETVGQKVGEDAYARLERENKRLAEQLEAERKALEQTRYELSAALGLDGEPERERQRPRKRSGS